MLVRDEEEEVLLLRVAVDVLVELEKEETTTLNVDPAGRSTCGHVQEVAVPGSSTTLCLRLGPSVSSRITTVSQEFSLAERCVSPRRLSSWEPMTEVKLIVAGRHCVNESGKSTRIDDDDERVGTAMDEEEDADDEDERDDGDADAVAA